MLITVDNISAGIAHGRPEGTTPEQFISPANHAMAFSRPERARSERCFMSYNKHVRQARRKRAKVAIKRQLMISRFYYSSDSGFFTRPQGRWRKQAALNCGQAGCFLCGNPRRVANELTLAERRAGHSFEAGLLEYFSQGE
jgi:hypothetical protein